jgi:hypothetical protein
MTGNSPEICIRFAHEFSIFARELLKLWSAQAMLAPSPRVALLPERRKHGFRKARLEHGSSTSKVALNMYESLGSYHSPPTGCP